MTQDARVVLVANGGGSNLRAAWSDNPAASWASTTTANLPQFSNGSASAWTKTAFSPSLNIIVAISNGGDNNYNNITTSGDGGTTWAQRQYPNANGNSWTMNDVCWCPGLGLFVIVTSAGPTSSTRILTSPDGINWTARTLPNTGVSLNAVVCGTISAADYIVAVGASNAIYTSTDGTNWTQQTGPGTSRTWIDICWASGQSKFIAIAQSAGGSNDEMDSTNGTSWTQRSMGGSGYSWQAIGYSADLDQCIVVGGNTGVIMYSAAGSSSTWTQFSTGLGSTAFSGVCWSSAYSTWVMIGNSMVYTCSTPNGTWTSQTVPNSNAWHGCVALPASTVVANNLGIDYNDNGGYNNLGVMSGFNGVSTHAMSITTTQADEIIVLFIEMEQLQATGAYATVSSITGGPGGWARYGSAYQWRGGRNGSSPFNWNTMEIWWTHATSVQSAASVTINTSATVDNLSASAIGFIGADIVSADPFDTNGLFTNNGGTSGTATTPTSTTNQVTTTAGSEIIFAFSGAPRAISANYPPTGYTTVYMGGDPFGTDWGEQELALGQPSTALSAATVAFGGSYTVANWGMIVGAIIPTQAPVYPNGPWASTEATDTMAFTGGVLGGSWNSTEADDVMAFVEYPNGVWASTDATDTMDFRGGIIGPWASVEAKDTMSFTGGVLGGSWHSTEADDVMAATGYPNSVGVWSSIEITDTMAGIGSSGAVATKFDVTTASAGIDFQALDMTVTNQEAYGSPVGAKSNTTHSSGKYYVEFTTRITNNNSGVGIGNALADFTDWGGATPAVNGAGIIQYEDGTIWVNGIQQSNWEAITLAAAVVRVAIDLDNNLIWFSINGNYWNGLPGGNPATGVDSPRPPSNQPQVGSGGYDISAITAHGPISLWAELVNAYDSVTVNAGATSFVYGVPSGFSAWDPITPAVAPLQIDGYATGAITEVGPSYDAITSGTVTLTTTQADDVIVVGISSGGYWNAARVESITSTSGLVFKRRNRRWQVGGYKSDGSTIVNEGLDTEIWWAHAPLVLSGEVITVNIDTTSYPGSGGPTSGTGSMSIIAAGISGANYTTPWDKHTQAGGYVDAAGASGTSLYYFPPTASLYTKATNALLLGFHSDFGATADAGVTQDPWAYVAGVFASEHDGYTTFLSLVYQNVEEPQFNTNVVVGSTVSGIGVIYTAANMMFDSIVAADEDGTDKEIVWFWDPHSANNVIKLTTGTTLQLSYSPMNFNLMVLVEVAIMSASGLGEVTSISETAGSLSTVGFERRSRRETWTPLGPLAVEIWWGWMPMYTSAERPSNDTLTINTSNCAPGDIIGAMVLGLSGATGAFGLGDPFWDVNPLVPAMNSNTSGSPPPYATDISTTIPSDLVVAWTANNTENVPGFTDPFVTLVQDYPHTINPTMQMNSNAPPLYTGFEFYYEPGLATNETAEFLLPTEPDGWVVIADAIPVGPPQPPSGTMEISDQQDKFTHTGDYTGIGIASPGGWVGAPENHGVMAAVENEDINGGTPNLGYSPFLGEGWLGGVAAHATWASTEGADQMALYGWVLGFGITGQMGAAEAKDRLASSNRSTVTGTLGAVEIKDRWASAGLVLPPGHIHPTPPTKRRLLIIT